MHPRNDIPSTVRYVQRFLYTSISQTHILFCYAVLMTDSGWIPYYGLGRLVIRVE